jgi:hypothetical protein
MYIRQNDHKCHAKINFKLFIKISSSVLSNCSQKQKQKKNVNSYVKL